MTGSVRSDAAPLPEAANERPVAPAERGLTSAEAAARLRASGPNLLPMPPAAPAWRSLARQMVHFFAVMLWVASGLAFIAGMPELGVAIAVIVVVNGVFAFLQEHRAEQAAERLRDLLPRRMTVIRDGQPRLVDAAEVVVGDRVLLQQGDRVSADLRILHASQLSIDTSTLTGESIPAVPQAGEPLFAGTFVVEGEGIGEVTATGASTRLAGIARLTGASRRPSSPLARELERVVRVVAAIAIGVGLLFFGVAVLLGFTPGAGFLFAIGVSVALVPEGLLPTVTLSLAVGAQRMAARNALVRRLESVESLGSTTFICTDKTGTLTCNEMSVVEVWTAEGTVCVAGDGYEPVGSVQGTPGAVAAAAALALAGARCSTGHAVRHGDRWAAEGDPMDAALEVLARRLGRDPVADEAARPTVRRFPFDPRRRRMSVLVDGQLLVKGAPDSLLPLSGDPAAAVRAAEEMAQRGLRVLAVSARAASAESAPGSPEEAERDLTLLGLVGIEDPARPGAAQAIAACRTAGIRIAMLTGDHPGTAASVAREVGLLQPGSKVLQGSDLPADDDELGLLLDSDGIVVSRVAPEDKLRIARALRSRGHVVAMTGDGVNDGPALHEADIGVAMGRSGTDVAREAADLVLLDDDFATIVAAVEQGRATFANVRRALTYHLTDNVAELAPFVAWALTAGRFPLALGVLQILCLDLGTDQLPALALGIEPPSPHMLQGPPRRGHLLDRALLGRVFGLLGPVEAALELVAFGAVLIGAGWRWGSPMPPPVVLAAASGAAFSTVVIGQMANALACRSSTRGPGALGWTSNRLLLWSLAIEAALLAAFLLPPFGRILQQSPPPAVGWALAVLAAPAVLTADAAQKWWRRRRLARSG